MLGHLRNKGCGCHAGLGVDFQPNKFALIGKSVIEAEVGSGYPAAADRLMRQKCQ